MATSEPVDILIVDDTTENIQFLSSLLSEQGYNVRKAISGKMALTAAKRRVPDLILLDIKMPQMDGYTVCQHLKNDPKTSDVPIIFLSALDEAADKVKAFQVGGVDYITKPFQFEEVLARIQNQLTIQNLQQQLQQTITELKATQAEIIQKEKMASLGQLVAGIAHEINNPITFIYSNIPAVREYINDLLQIIQSYCQEYPHPSESLQELLEETDLDFTISDLPKLIDSMEVGAERIRSTVFSLQNFSQLEASHLKPTDIHKNLDSTLQMLQHRLQPSPAYPHLPTIKIIKNYGDLPLVTCYANRLNQVFFYILNNAIDALQAAIARGTAHCQQPTIWISTKILDNDRIQIAIADNGVGMSEETRSHLFDPFFTTKPVGEGSGLGLYASYQIVTNEHGGNLICHSATERGTEFFIQLPKQIETSPH
jgi:signal transduction histidine kinase